MKVLVVIDRDSAFREMVRSPVLGELAGRPGVQLVLLTNERYRVLPEDLPEGVKVTCRVVDFGPASTLRGKVSYVLDKLIHGLSRDVSCARHPESTLAQIRNSLLRARGVNPRRRLAYARLLVWLGLRSRHLAAWAECWGHHPEIPRVLDEEKPDVIVYSNMMMGQMDCLRTARRRRIPLLLDLLS